MHKQVDSRLDRRQYPKRKIKLVESRTTNVKYSLWSSLKKINYKLSFCQNKTKLSYARIWQGYAKLAAVLSIWSEKSLGYWIKIAGAKI